MSNTIHQDNLPVVLLLGASAIKISNAMTLHSVPDELKDTKAAFEAGKKASHYPFNIEYEPFFETGDLDKLTERDITILHFAGHSDGASLQSDDGLVYSKHIAGILKQWKSRPSLVFLNGCHNAEQVKLFHDAGVAVVIATHKAIKDGEARAFAPEFYKKLFSRDDITLQQAFATAGEMVFSNSPETSRSLDIDNMDKLDSGEWDWGLFAKDPEHAETWTIRHLLTESRPVLDKNGNLLNPYRGLEAFREQDRHFFFGWESLRGELLKKIQAAPFFALLGASGSGKSSLIKAGIIPVLRETGDWLILQTTPGDDPFKALAKTLADEFFADDPIKYGPSKRAWESELQAAKASLVDAITFASTKSGDKKVLLLIDQFEELFTQSLPPTVQTFQTRLDELVNAIRKGLPCTVLLVMRADFLGKALDYPELAALLNKSIEDSSAIFLPPMKEDELRSIIVRPAKKQQVEIDTQVTDALLYAVKNQHGSLPLLQHVLKLLWEKREGRRITRLAYEALGGLQQALSDYADNAYNDLISSEGCKDQQGRCKEVFEQIFVLYLIQPSTETLGTRRRAYLHEFKNLPEAETILHGLAAKRLITIQQGKDEKEAYAEIAHETLILHWPLLKDWLAKNQDMLRAYHELKADAKDWDKNERDVAWLQSGLRLSNAEQWLKTYGERIPSQELKLVHEYIQASLDEHQHILREAEQKELQINFALAKSFEGKVVSSIKKGDELRKNQDYGNSLDEYRKAYLYALEAQQKPLPANANPITPQTLNHLVSLNNSLLSNELRTINVGRAVQALSYSPDGKIVAVGSTSGTVLLDVESGGHLTTLRSGNTWTLMYSPDGINIATANVEFGDVEVWGANILDKVFLGRHYYECELKKRLKIKEGVVLVYGLAYSPDGKHIAVAAGDHNVYIFNIENSDKPKVLEGHAEAVTALAFSPDSKKLASGSADKTLRLWDVYSGKTISILSGHSGSILSLAYSSNGRNIVSGSHDKTVRLWDVEKAETTQILLGHSQRIWAVAYSLNDRVIASGSDDRTVLLWNANNGELIDTLKGHTDSVQTVVFLSCGKIVSGSLNGKLIEWKDEYSDEDDFTYVAEKALIDKQGYVLALACHPNGKMIASGSEDKILRLWSLQSGSVEKYLKGHLGAVKQVVYGQNGKIVASRSDGNEIKLWDTDSGGIIRTLSDHEEPVVSMAYSPDGRFFASSDRMLIKLRDAENYSVIRQVRTSNIVSFIFDSDSESLIILVGDFHRDSNGFLNQMFANMLIDDKDDYSWKAGMAYDSKNKVLAFGGVENSNVEIWDIYGEKKFDLYSSSQKFDRSNDPSSIRLLDVINKKIIATLSGHHGKILDLAFSSNGKLLASASADKTVRLWHVKTGSLLNIFNDHVDTVLALAFSSSPSGEVLLSAGKDGVIKVRPINDIYQLLYHFESKDVSAILKFLWKMNLFDLEFKDELTPLQLDEKYQSLSEPPYPNETKLDQVVRLLEEQNAYRTTPLISPPVSDER